MDSQDGTHRNTLFRDAGFLSRRSANVQPRHYSDRGLESADDTHNEPEKMSSSPSRKPQQCSSEGCFTQAHRNVEAAHG